MVKKILITDIVPDFFIWELKKMKFKVDEIPGISYQDCIKIIPQYHGLFIRSGLFADKALLTQATNLKFILRPGSGLDIIDVDFAISKNIILINSPEGNRDAVAEHAIGMLLALLKKICNANTEMTNLIFDRQKNTGTELGGKTVGIIGYGNTGAAFANRLQSFNVRILAFDKYKKNYAPSYVIETHLQTILNESEIISLHLPYNSETHYFINKEFISSVKQPFILINTSRGKIVKTSDLVEAIENKKIKGVCMDVFENEQFNNLTESQKNELDFLIKSKKAILTPHIAGKTKESELKIHSILIEKLILNQNKITFTN